MATFDPPDPMALRSPAPKLTSDKQAIPLQEIKCKRKIPTWWTIDPKSPFKGKAGDLCSAQPEQLAGGILSLCGRTGREDHGRTRAARSWVQVVTDVPNTHLPQPQRVTLQSAYA
jgi:hypothetical protein